MCTAATEHRAAAMLRALARLAPAITDTEFRVLAVLADEAASRDTDAVTGSVRGIAAATGAARSAIERALRTLHAAALIHRTPATGQIRLSFHRVSLLEGQGCPYQRDGGCPYQRDT